MREVIEQLVTVEAEAQRIVQAARADADGILADAQRQTEAMVVRGREETRRAAEELLAAAIASAERDTQARLAQAGQEIDAQVRLSEDAIERFVTEIVRCVTCGH